MGMNKREIIGFGLGLVKLSILRSLPYRSWSQEWCMRLILLSTSALLLLSVALVGTENFLGDFLVQNNCYGRLSYGQHPLACIERPQQHGYAERRKCHQVAERKWIVWSMLSCSLEWRSSAFNKHEQLIGGICLLFSEPCCVPHSQPCFAGNTQHAQIAVKHCRLHVQHHTQIVHTTQLQSF